MSAYRPPAKPLSQKLSENLLVQLGIVFVVAIVAIYMITKNQKESFWSRVHFLRGSSTQISQSQDANQYASDSMEAAQLQEQAVAAGEAAPLAKSNAPQAKIYFLEIPQAVLGKWLEEGLLTRVETSDEITIGYIPQLTTMLEQYKAQIKVVRQEAYAYNLNQLYTAKLETLPTPAPTAANSRAVASTAEVAAGSVPGAAPIFTAYATLDDDRNDTLTGQLEVSVNPQSSFPAQFEMTPDQSFFISGFDRTRTQDRTNPQEMVIVLKIDK